MAKKETIRSGALSAEIAQFQTGAHAGKWRIRYYDLNGKRRTGGLFKDKEKAKDRAYDILEELNSSDVGKLSYEEMQMVRIIRESNISLEDVLKLSKSVKASATITMNEAIDMFEDKVLNEKRLSKSQRNTYDGVIREVRAHVGVEMLHNVTLDDVESVTDTWNVGPSRFNNKRSVLNVIMKYLVDRQIMQHNHVAAIPLKDDNNDEAHPIYTPKEFKILLKHCPENYLPWLVIAGFAGLRGKEIYGDPSEGIVGLEWEDILWDEKVIIVQRNKTKRKRNGKEKMRPVDMPDVLIEWLKPFKKEKGLVFEAVIPHHGRNSITKKIGKHIGGWKQNALRASSISYFLALTKNIDAVVLAHGHTKEVMLDEYLNPRMKKAAKKWYALTPEKVGRKIA